jgi:hypothetical protein
MGSDAMKNSPPVLHGNEWEWPSDGGADAWPDYLKGIPVRRLLRQIESSDVPWFRRDSNGGYQIFDKEKGGRA